MGAGLPEELIIELKEATANAERLRHAVDTTVEVGRQLKEYKKHEPKDDEVVKKPKDFKILLTTKERIRLQRISEEMFTGATVHAKEVRDTIDFRNRMGSRYDNAKKKINDIITFKRVQQKAFDFGLKHVFALGVIAYMLVPPIRFRFQKVFKNIFSPLIDVYNGIVQWLNGTEVVQKMREVKEKVGEAINKSFGIKKIKELSEGGKIALNERVQRMKDGLAGIFNTFKNKAHPYLIPAVNVLGWITLGAGIGAFFGGLPGAAIGAIVGLVVGLIDSYFTKKRQEQETTDRHSHKLNYGNLKGYEEALTHELSKVNEEIENVLKKTPFGKDTVQILTQLEERQELLIQKHRNAMLQRLFMADHSDGLIKLLNSLGHRENIDYTVVEVETPHGKKKVVKSVFGATDDAAITEKLMSDVDAVIRASMESITFSEDLRKHFTLNKDNISSVVKNASMADLIKRAEVMGIEGFTKGRGVEEMLLFGKRKTTSRGLTDELVEKYQKMLHERKTRAQEHIKALNASLEANLARLTTLNNTLKDKRGSLENQSIQNAHALLNKQMKEFTDGTNGYFEGLVYSIRRNVLWLISSLNIPAPTVNSERAGYIDSEIIRVKFLHITSTENGNIDVKYVNEAIDNAESSTGELLSRISNEGGRKTIGEKITRCRERFFSRLNMNSSIRQPSVQTQVAFVEYPLDNENEQHVLEDKSQMEMARAIIVSGSNYSFNADEDDISVIV